MDWDFWFKPQSGLTFKFNLFIVIIIQSSIVGYRLLLNVSNCSCLVWLKSNWFRFYLDLFFPRTLLLSIYDIKANYCIWLTYLHLHVWHIRFFMMTIFGVWSLILLHWFLSRSLIDKLIMNLVDGSSTSRLDLLLRYFSKMYDAFFSDPAKAWVANK